MLIRLNSPKHLQYLTRVVILIIASSIYGVSQEPARRAHKAPPELKVRIVPDKEAYFLHENVLAKAEFTNQTDKTLCFPLPSQRGDAASGYIVLEGTPVSGNSDRAQFVEHVDGRSSENLIEEIEKHWIKLAPNATFMANLSNAHVDLDVIGTWSLKGTYYPSQCSFDVAVCNEHLRSTAKSTGCTAPENYVSVVPVTINVVPLPEQK